jgi:hypothetical protein
MKRSYELYKFDRDDLGGHITLYVDDDSLMIEDYTIGSTCENFFGRDDREYRVSVDSAGAATILGHYGLTAAGGPVEALGRWLGATLKGCSTAATRFEELAGDAGVSVNKFVW